MSGELKTTSSCPSFKMSLPDTFLIRVSFLAGGYLSTLLWLFGVLGSWEECFAAGDTACRVGSSSRF